MFLKKLYQYNRLLFYTFLAFLLAFIFLNFKWGVVASPVYQFGMFSGPMHITDTVRSYEIHSGDIKISNSRLPFAERDMQWVLLQKYESQKEKNKAVYEVMKRLLKPAGLGKLMSEDLYSNHVTQQQFISWYKHLLRNIPGIDTGKLTILRHAYIWDRGALKSLDQKEEIILAE